MVVRLVFVLTVLCAPLGFATEVTVAEEIRKFWVDREGRLHEGERPESDIERRERLLHPEIALARRILESPDDPPEVVRSARAAVENWQNAIVDPEPILLMAALIAREFAENGGRLHLTVVDEDKDLLGLRIKEKYRLPNGVESSMEEDYPLYGEHEGWYPSMEQFVVRYRTGTQRKNEMQWRTWLEQVQDDSDAQMPPIWVSVPESNRVEVFASVYDRAGHESEWIPVEWASGNNETPAKDTREFQEYERHGTEIPRWPQEGTAWRPDNAALLYYRAAACIPTPDPCTAVLTNLLSKGHEPDDRVRAYLGRCLKGIRLAHLASRIPQCDWGLIYDPASDLTMETMASLRRLSFALSYRAQTLAADGHYRAALEDCLVNRRLARHIGDDTWIIYCVSRDVGAHGTFPMLRILADMPLDVETLTWLRDELARAEGTPLRPAVAFERWADLEVQWWKLQPAGRSFERSWGLAQITNEAKRRKAMDLTDEQLLVRLLRDQRMYPTGRYNLAMPAELLDRAREGYDRFVESAIAVMESDLPFVRKRARLDELEGEQSKRRARYEPVAVLADAPTKVETYYAFAIYDKAFLNCARVAVEVLLIVARTGPLPEALPAGLPADPHTGKDFEYQRTEDGFLLRVDPAGASDRGAREFEFTVDRP